MAEIRIFDLENARTIKLLRLLLETALSNQVTGIMVGWTTRDGQEHSQFTGAYCDVTKAAKAAMRLSWEMTLREDARSGAHGPTRGNHAKR